MGSTDEDSDSSYWENLFLDEDTSWLEYAFSSQSLSSLSNETRAFNLGPDVPNTFGNVNSSNVDSSSKELSVIGNEGYNYIEGHNAKERCWKSKPISITKLNEVNNVFLKPSKLERLGGNKEYLSSFLSGQYIINMPEKGIPGEELTSGNMQGDLENRVSSQNSHIQEMTVSQSSDTQRMTVSQSSDIQRMEISLNSDTELMSISSQESSGIETMILSQEILLNENIANHEDTNSQPMISSQEIPGSPMFTSSQESSLCQNMIVSSQEKFNRNSFEEKVVTKLTSTIDDFVEQDDFLQLANRIKLIENEGKRRKIYRRNKFCNQRNRLYKNKIMYIKNQEMILDAREKELEERKKKLDVREENIIKHEKFLTRKHNLEIYLTDSKKMKK